jgi:hypothetical protein
MNREQFNELIINSNQIFPGIFGEINTNRLEDLYNQFNERNQLYLNYLENITEINYLAIAEAPTDINNSYFYSLEALNRTPWFNVPLEYFSQNHVYSNVRSTENKILALTVLNENGFVLADISPVKFELLIINRNTVRFKKLINFLLENYFFKFVFPFVLPKITNTTKTILMGTMVTDRIVYDFNCKNNYLTNNLALKGPGQFEEFNRYTLSSACATNGPISRLFTNSIAD